MYYSNGHHSRLAREHNQCCFPAGKMNKEPMKRAINCPEKRWKITFDFTSLLVRVWSDYGSFTEFLLQTSTELATSSLPLRRRKWKLCDTLWKHTYFMRTSKKKLASHKRTFLNRGNAYTRWPFFPGKIVCNCFNSISDCFVSFSFFFFFFCIPLDPHLCDTNRCDVK